MDKEESNVYKGVDVGGTVLYNYCDVATQLYVFVKTRNVHQKNAFYFFKFIFNWRIVVL